MPVLLSLDFVDDGRDGMISYTTLVAEQHTFEGRHGRVMTSIGSLRLIMTTLTSYLADISKCFQFLEDLGNGG